LRVIRDEYSLPDGEYDEPYEFRLGPRRRGVNTWLIIALLAAFVVLIGAVGYVNANETNDASCVSCHTPQHTAYAQRSQSALNGVLAPDLASFHYQALRTQSKSMTCIACHRGENTFVHQTEKWGLSLSNLALWLAGKDDKTVEKRTLKGTALVVTACASCHTEKLLLGGMDNHAHNTLPAAYDLWKSGGRLIAPPNAPDPQAIIVAGLQKYNTAVTCTTCHLAHWQTDATNYQDEARVINGCNQCHAEIKKGILPIATPAPKPVN